MSVMPFIILGLFGLYTLELGVVGILPIIVERYHVTIAQAGLLMSLFAFIVALTGPFLVLVFSRVDRKKVLVGALFCFSLSSILSAFAPNYSTLMLLRIAPAMLHPVFFSTVFSAAISLYPKEKSAHATTLAFVGTTLGLVFGVPITGWLADVFSYEVATLFCALATLLAGVGLLLTLPPQVDRTPTTFGHQLSILLRAPVWLAIIATILVFTAKFSVYSYAAEYLRTETGLGVQAISLLLVIFGIGGVTGNLLAGRMLSRSIPFTALLFPVLLAAMYLVLYASDSASLSTIVPIVFLWGAVHTSGMIVTQMLLTSTAPEAHAFATSLYVSAANAGIALGAWIGGVFIEAFGVVGTIWSGLGFATATFLVIAAKLSLYGRTPRMLGATHSRSR